MAENCATDCGVVAVQFAAIGVPTGCGSACAAMGAFHSMISG